MAIVARRYLDPRNDTGRDARRNNHSELFHLLHSTNRKLAAWTAVSESPEFVRNLFVESRLCVCSEKNVWAKLSKAESDDVCCRVARGTSKNSGLRVGSEDLAYRFDQSDGFTSTRPYQKISEETSIGKRWNSRAKEDKWSRPRRRTDDGRDGL